MYGPRTLAMSVAAAERCFAKRMTLFDVTSRIAEQSRTQNFSSEKYAVSAAIINQYDEHKAEFRLWKSQTFSAEIIIMSVSPAAPCFAQGVT